MTEATAGGARGRWGAAAALTAAVLLLSALDAVPLVAFPLALLLLALPYAPRWRWITLGVLVWLLGASFPAGPLGDLSRGWALLLGGSFLGATLARPAWGVLHRGLLAVAVSLVAATAWLALGGGWSETDAAIREHLLTVSTMVFDGLGGDAAEGGVSEGLGTMAREVALLQWRLFPALLGLQSLAALALVSWTMARLRRAESGPFVLGPLRDFRFHDQLVWLLIAGLVAVVLPVGEVAARVAQNVLLFMGGLYALRGAAVLVYLVGGAPSILAVVFAALAAVFLYPLVLTVAVLVGLGDTWLDVRGRVALAPRP